MEHDLFGKPVPTFPDHALVDQPEPAAGLVRYVGIYIDVNVVDAALRRPVGGIAMPSAVAALRIVDVRKIEAAPLAANRPAMGVVARELKYEHCFLAVLVAEDIGTDFAMLSVISQRHLFTLENGAMEEELERRAVIEARQR
jgi:hypothetical protein